MMMARCQASNEAKRQQYKPVPPHLQRLFQLLLAQPGHHVGRNSNRQLVLSQLQQKRQEQAATFEYV
jgi:hypothetical protein